MKDMNNNNHMVVLSHPICITRLDVIIGLLKKEKHIKPRCIPQILAALGMATLTLPAVAAEYLFFSHRPKKQKMQGPVFVMGHWRSGTTLVQYLLAQDKQFGNFDPVYAFSYNYYHLLGWLFHYLTKGQLSETRPQDNMRLSLDLPLEEYMVYANIEVDSLYPVNYFPQSFARYMDNSYWQNLPAQKAASLKKKYDRMLKNCTQHTHGKRLLLKSPDNTGRILPLYEMYPDAKFINIYRNPYTVIRSTIHLYEKTFSMWALQEVPAKEELEDAIIQNFKRMYEEYFAALEKIPKEAIYEIRFEDFEKNPFPYLKEAYAALDLGDYAEAEAGFREYWKAEEGYEKNKFDYPQALKEKIDANLGFYFEHYGYSMEAL